MAKPGSAITVDRIEKAMEVVAIHMRRHIRSSQSSPFVPIFSALEKEYHSKKLQQETTNRALEFLSQRATFDSHSNFVSKDDPEP